MANTLTMPATFDDALAQLGTLGELARATNWQRAAIVATYVAVLDGRGSHVRSEISDLIGTVEFARLGIVGLASDKTVAVYVRAWLDVRPRPLPGDVVNFDGLGTWPPTTLQDTRTRAVEDRDDIVAAAQERNPNSTGAKALDIAKNRGAMCDALKGSPALAAAALAALKEMGLLTERKAPTVRAQPRADEPTDDGTVVRYGHYLLGAYIAQAAGRYTPSAAAAMILAALRPTVDWDAELADVLDGGL